MASTLDGAIALLTLSFSTSWMSRDWLAGGLVGHDARRALAAAEVDKATHMLLVSFPSGSTVSMGWAWVLVWSGLWSEFGGELQ